MNASATPWTVEQSIPLAPMTTLQVGGCARQLVRIRDQAQARSLVAWLDTLAADERPGLLPLGGGSNLLVSDAGFPGLVLKMENRGLDLLEESPERVTVRVGAGTVWDDFVADTVSRDWSGVECLSGIPGSVGASPVQNIGAYGQEVAESIVAVHGFHLPTGQEFSYTNEQCGFSYRDSFFKRAGQGEYWILAVDFALTPGGTPTVAYRDLQERCRERQVSTLSELRELVLQVRREKSMVYDPSDPNHRSAGSFFTNPIVEEALAERLVAEFGMPCYPAGVGRRKLSAAWLIEQSGLPKGFKPSPESKVGLSTRHVLALTNRGGASASELVELARLVTERVRERFQVTLVPEPVWVGTF